MTRLEIFYSFVKHHEPCFLDSGNMVRFCSGIPCSDCKLSQTIDDICETGGHISICEREELKIIHPEYFI